MGDYLTVQELSVEAGVTVNTVWRWLKEGKIEGKKFGRFWRISKTELAKILPETKHPE